ncbi:MAG: Lrp/AsnC family transcriptional regulator [Gammaproteobacteria bacterium]|nr:Lrp/AsnC family transcriptional regulator [Gammaproteobacteria bacterium]MBL7000661.1 Lrp/AsnC family transcriptional regulator [Gammaproteobacteria bacterium]
MSLQDALSIALINRFQGGFPLVEQPYAEVAALLGSDEASIISSISTMLNQGWLSRFGPLYDAKQMGGGLTLAALAVPEYRFDKVAKLVNSYAEVAHNYQREHKLNMWFVVATETQQGIADVIQDIELRSGLPVYNCPKQQEFYVGLQLSLGASGEVDTVPLNDSWLSAGLSRNPTTVPDVRDRKLIAATQAGLTLISRPYEQLARLLDMSSTDVMQRLQSMLDNGTIRRIGLVPNHYKLGLRGNGMTVWDVPDEMVQEIGELIGSMDFVSHCYQRPRHPPHWSYNLFAMIHGADRDQVMHKLAIMQQKLSPYNFQHKVLFSTAVLKKTGLRLAN